MGPKFEFWWQIWCSLTHGITLYCTILFLATFYRLFFVENIFPAPNLSQMEHHNMQNCKNTRTEKPKNYFLVISCNLEHFIFWFPNQKNILNWNDNEFLQNRGRKKIPNVNKNHSCFKLPEMKRKLVDNEFWIFWHPSPKFFCHPRYNK